MHAKFVAFSRTEIEIQQLQKVIEKIEIVSDRVIECQKILDRNELRRVDWYRSCQGRML